MLEWLLQTDRSVAGLILRLTLAAVIFPHGTQKAFEWFGGDGFKNALQFFASSGIPTGFALLAIAAEFLGSLGLAVGFLTRVAAFGIASVMLVAIALMIMGGGTWSVDGALGQPAIGTLAEFVQHTRLKEHPGHYPGARAMLANLLTDHEAVIQRLRVDLATCDEAYHDMGTNDFLTGLMARHEKMAWRLRAFLEGV